jgi:hypothetical protein
LWSTTTFCPYPRLYLPKSGPHTLVRSFKASLCISLRRRSFKASLISLLNIALTGLKSVTKGSTYKWLVQWN